MSTGLFPAQMKRVTMEKAPPVTGRRCYIEKMGAGALISVDTTDFEEFCDFALGWNIDHQLMGREKPHITMSGVATPILQLAIVQQSAGYSSQGMNPKGAFSVAVPLDEARTMIHCGHIVEPLEMATVHSGADFEVLNRAGAHHVIASFSQLRLEQYAHDVWHEPHLSRHSSDRLQFPSTAHRQQFLSACHTILGDVRKQPSLLRDSRRTSLLEDRLLENFLLQAYVDPQHPAGSNRYQIARRAYRYLLESIEEVPSIRNLCAMTGASYATLERGYREIYGMAPQAHIKALRLSRARKQLRQPDATTTVTEVAVRWGFFELGRFSVQYRQRFGETPSDTLRKARGDSWLFAGAFIHLGRS